MNNFQLKSVASFSRFLDFIIMHARETLWRAMATASVLQVKLLLFFVYNLPIGDLITANLLFSYCLWFSWVPFQCCCCCCFSLHLPIYKSAAMSFPEHEPKKKCAAVLKKKLTFKYINIYIYKAPHSYNFLHAVRLHSRISRQWKIYRLSFLSSVFFVRNKKKPKRKLTKALCSSMTTLGCHTMRSRIWRKWKAKSSSAATTHKIALYIFIIQVFKSKCKLVIATRSCYMHATLWRTYM